MLYLWLAIVGFMVIAFAIGAYFGEREVRRRWNGPEDIGGDELFWSLGLAGTAVIVVAGVEVWYQLSWIFILLTVWLLPVALLLIFYVSQYLWGREGDSNNYVGFRTTLEMIGLALAWPAIIPYVFWCFKTSRRLPLPRLPH